MIDQPIPLIVRRMIDAERSQIFEAFSRADLLAQWFTPSPEISLEVLEFDFAVDGRFRLRYTLPDGRRPVVGGVYERIAPPKEIILSWIWEAPDPLAGIPMRVLFRFIEKDVATEVVITHERLPSDAVCTIHAEGWEGALNSLDRYMTAPSH
ncbi:MAG: SRPBCC family protein [Geminicoccaceae bacterium]